MLTLTSKSTGSNFLDETAQYMIDTYGYRAESFLNEKIEVTITGDAADLARLVEEADASMIPCCDEIGGTFFTDAACLELLKNLIATL